MSAAADPAVVSNLVASGARGGSLPWWLPFTPRWSVVIPAEWLMAVLAFAGVGAGLTAVARGARPSSRLLVTGAFLIVAALAVLPPAGSKDALNYAVYGRIAVLGHSPYVMTAQQLIRTGDPIGRAARHLWQHQASTYGPLATAEQWAAAELGGISIARITFWLKLWNALAFLAVVLALDRIFRSNPALRARAHLLWSVNPFALWGVVAAGHIDGIGAALGFAGVAALSVRRPGERPDDQHALAAGFLIGAAAAIKVTFALYGIGVAWAAMTTRRLAAVGPFALAGFLAFLAPAYLLAGRPAVVVLLRRSTMFNWGNLYELLYRPLGYSAPPPDMQVVAYITFAAVALLALWRLPAGFPDRPFVRPALAITLAWLFTWPYHYLWYDVAGLCLLVLYPATLLDWAVLLRLLAAALVSLPGGPTGHIISRAELAAVGNLVAPLANLAAVLILVCMCLPGPRRRFAAPGQAGALIPPAEPAASAPQRR
ncbi:MAG: hypothetical protein ACHP9Z_23375 [Streptosporangiales bacterium]